MEVSFANELKTKLNINAIALTKRKMDKILHDFPRTQLALLIDRTQNTSVVSCLRSLLINSEAKKTAIKAWPIFNKYIARQGMLDGTALYIQLLFPMLDISAILNMKIINSVKTENIRKNQLRSRIFRSYFAMVKKVEAIYLRFIFFALFSSLQGSFA